MKRATGLNGVWRAVCLGVGLAAAPGWSEEAAPRRTLIKAARMLDVRQGVLVSDASVLVEGNKIVAVGVAAVDPNAVVIDLGSACLMPGLIDVHTHLLSNAGNRYGNMLLTKSQAYRALEGAVNARKMVLAGFTTVRDVENEGAGFADVALRDAIRRGLMIGPRMQVATRGIAAVGQYFPFGVSPDLQQFPTGAQTVSGPEECRRAVREQIGAGADLIKVYADWEYPTLTVQELQVIVEEAHKAGRKVAAHATTVQGIRNALEAGVDSIEHGFGADRPTLERMREKGVWLVPTIGPLANLLEKAQDAEERAYLEQQLQSSRQAVRTAREVGVKIACGYDASEEALHGTSAREILALREAGLSNLEALRAATLSAAELMGLEKQIGLLEAGFSADVIAVAADPLTRLETVQEVLFVLKDGVVLKSDAIVAP